MKLPQSGFRRAFSASVILTIALVLPALAGAQQLTATPAALRFGKVITGQTRTLQVTLTNNGSSGITVKSVQNAPQFTMSSPSLPVKLAAGMSTQIAITYTPTTLGQILATVTLTSTASNSSLQVPVRGAGVTEWALTANPTSLAFGSVPTGSSSTLPVVLTNSGAAEITISQDEAKGTGFSLSGLPLPLNLAPGDSYTFNATFAPQSTGSASGALWISNPKSTIVKVFVNGVGTAAGQLTMSPATINFGNVVDGTSASQTGTLTATGASVTITSTNSNNPEFSVAGLSFPVTLAAGHSTNFTVSFSPQSSGAASETLTFSSNATSTPSASLSGTGIAPYSVSLSWDASSSQVSGYNVYRGGKNGGPYTKIDTLDSNTSYTDSTVASGNTYYYVTTAVNSSGQESSYSNQVKAVIP